MDDEIHRAADYITSCAWHYDGYKEYISYNGLRKLVHIDAHYPMMLAQIIIRGSYCDTEANLCWNSSERCLIAEIDDESFVILCIGWRNLTVVANIRQFGPKLGEFDCFLCDNSGNVTHFAHSLLYEICVGCHAMMYGFAEILFGKYLSMSQLFIRDVLVNIFRVLVDIDYYAPPNLDLIASQDYQVIDI